MSCVMKTNRYFQTFLICAVAVLVTILGYHYKQQTVVTSYHVLQNRELAVDSEYSALEKVLSENMKLTNYSGQGTKYIVYDCSKARKVQCNGWSDRIAGIMTTFIISILAKRHFLINFDKPCFLQDYVIPAHFDWRYNSSILLNRTSSFHDLKNGTHQKIDQYMFRGNDFNTYFKHDVIFLLFNWDFIIDFRKRPNIGYDVPWITKYHQADIYKYIFNFLFKLSHVSVRALNHQYRKQKKTKIACAHIRGGRNSNMPRDVKRPGMPLDILWKYFNMFNKDEYDLFVASDTDSIKSLAKERYPKRMIDTPGKISHIDQPNQNDPREGFLKQLLEFYILVGCDTLLFSGDSGFSMLAAFIRNMDYGLYCWQGRDIIPCSRYTMTDIFPIGKFGKEKHMGW